MQMYICIIQLTVIRHAAIIFAIMAESLNWEATYAIALALKAAHPQVDLENVSLRMIFHWTLALSNFEDDPALANDDILLAIYQDWFEEIL
jgi:FeS assembly protein IscX